MRPDSTLTITKRWRMKGDFCCAQNTWYNFLQFAIQSVTYICHSSFIYEINFQLSLCKHWKPLTIRAAYNRWKTSKNELHSQVLCWIQAIWIFFSIFNKRMRIYHCLNRDAQYLFAEKPTKDIRYFPFFFPSFLKGWLTISNF